MDVSLTPGALKKFRRTPWRFQQTIEVPQSRNLEALVSTIFKKHNLLQRGSLIIDEVVFNTVKLTELCGEEVSLVHDNSISASSPEELQRLLVAALWDGVDFLCIPTPKPFVFYSDHDDWITFYANSKSQLNLAVEALWDAGYKMVDWEREF